MSRTKRITLRLPQFVVQGFDDVCGRIGLAKDPYLVRVLPKELNRLALCTPGDAVGMRFIRKEMEPFYVAVGNVRKPVTPTLTDELVGRMDALCAEKFIHRDIFFEYALRFFVVRLLPVALRIEDPYSELVDDLDRAFDEQERARTEIEEAASRLTELDPTYASPEKRRELAEALATHRAPETALEAARWFENGFHFQTENAAVLADNYYQHVILNADQAKEWRAGISEMVTSIRKKAK